MYAIVYNVVFVFSSSQNPVSLVMGCMNGQDTGANYEVVYTNSSDTLITTCVVNCNDSVCRHELRNNITDSRCQPRVPQFNNESVTVTVTARNIVGRSNSTSELFIVLYSTSASNCQLLSSEVSLFVCISITTSTTLLKLLIDAYECVSNVITSSFTSLASATSPVVCPA